MNHFRVACLSLLIIASAMGCSTGNRGSKGALLEQTDVFVAGQDGVAQYRIPVLVTSNKGTLLAFCDARVKRSGDPPNDIDLVMKRSTDGGRTWGPLKTLVDNGEEAIADSCGLVDRQTGTIWVFSVYAPVGVGSSNAAVGLTGATFFYKAIKSDDDGETWSQPIDITPMVKKPEWSAGSTGVGKGIQMRNGRLVVPRYHADYHRPGSTGTEETTYSSSYVSYSDDHGQTWKMGADAESQGTTNECQVAEMADGSLLLNMRGTRGNNRKTARSRDGGITWTDAVEDLQLIEPRCQGSLESYTNAIDHDKNRLLFANPASLKRQNMTVRLSYDDGRTWPVAKQIHAGPAAYSCLTVLADMTAACLYERGDKSAYEKITYARFNVEWLTGGKDAIAKKQPSQ
ncbi:MAG: exo-alpha-sialidase [Acidimicrobiia bacterium]|nr:exo-alpha-sialidase [Acidimicrobiia bacterium]